MAMFRSRISQLVVLSWLAAACNETNPADSCRFAVDGKCDEPVNCKLGTDSTDCVAACAERRDPYLLGAACAYRAAPPDAGVSAEGSGGSVNLTGYRDGTIEVPSGEDASKTIARHYRLYVPPSYDRDRATPLVINMPGHRVSHYVLPGNTALDRTAEANRFIVAYVEQEWRRKALRWAWWTDWRWTTATRDNPDLLLIERLIERIAREYNLDRRRVYVSGHSRGAAMSIIAALELPNQIAGACSESGFTEFGYHLRIERYDGRKVPMVFVHGTIDDDVCIDCTSGGRCGVQPTRSCGGVEASDALVKLLRSKGWTKEQLVYHRLKNVAHRWQPQLNQSWWDFLSARPLPRDAVKR